MSRSTSRLTEKFQATIPLPIRRHLRLAKGDVVLFEIVRDQVVLRRATPLDLAYANAVADTLAEWNSSVDDDAYRDL